MGRKFFLFHIFALILILPSPCFSSGDDSLAIEQINDRGKQYASEGNFDAAEKAFDSIMLIDPSSVKARNNLGIIYKRLGRYNDALRVYSEAESIVKNEFGPSSPELARLYMNIGIIYNQKQDYELALQYLNFAESLFRVSDIQTNQASFVYNNIGNSYFGMRDWRKALQSYQKGIQVKKALNFGGLHIAYANCASTYENLEKLDSARMYYDYSIQSKIEGWGPENFRLIITYNNYGVLLQNMGEGELAFQYLEEALKLATEYYSEKHPEIADCHRRLGAWYLEEGNAVLALEYYQKGVNAVVFDYNNPDIYDNPLLDAEIISEPVFLEVLLGKASALAILYQQNQEIDALIASLATLELANMLAEKMRSAYLGQESKLFITEYARKGFDKSIRTAFDLYKLTGELEYANKAFIYAEKSKSSVLLASLQEVENKKNLGIPSELQVFEQDLKRETDTYKKKLYEERQGLSPDSLKLARLQGKLLNLSQQLDSLDDVIREKFPEFATKYNNEVIGLKGVMNGLDSEHVLVEYSLSDSSLFIFVVSNEDYYITSLLIDSSFHKNVDVLSRFLRNNDFNNNTIDDYRTYLHAGYYLYQTFLLPVEEQILGKKLIIIPDGELGYIPFEALLTELPSGEMMDYRTLPYLIYKYRTNYAYSATLHFSDNNRQENPPEQLLAFAPTYENVSEISSDKFPTFRDYSTSLVPLRFISSEIENISAIIDCDSYEGYEATEQAFRENAPFYDILHLAMHTLINDENPMYSQLVFTLNNDTIEENDGLLNAYEIFNMQFNARMAVLSACNTGSGKLQKGEGIMSMARGFIFAGVPSVIMTLWAVEDQSGSILMTGFYQNLDDGMDIDEALQEAKLSYLRDADQLGAHPYLWSGYVCIGDTRALISPAFGKLYQLILAVLGLGIIIFLIYRFRRKRA